MPKSDPIPEHLGSTFTVRDAAAAGVSPARLRRDNLRAPFRGIRSRGHALNDGVHPDASAETPYDVQARTRREDARLYAPRLSGTQFISHESAAALFHAPLPLAWTADGCIAGPSDLPVHVSTFGTGHLIRAQGVSAHRARRRTSRFTYMEQIPVADPDTIRTSLGHLPLIDLVALGDFFCRVWREGFGRPDASRPPLTTVERLQKAIDAGRRTGITRLRQAIDLIREDSWSPKETAVRCHLVFGGLPEPDLNHDVYDEHGRFLGCVDLAYPDLKIAIEYQGVLHHVRYSADVERLAALRAAGWIVIEVTTELLSDPSALVERVRHARRARRP